MPRKQDYNQSVIYHIRCIETKEVIYVGSTTNFENRKRSHKNVCNNEKDKNYNLSSYCHIRNNGGFDYFEVIPVIFLNLESKTQLLIEEQKEMDKYDTLLNKQFPVPSIQHKKELKKKHDFEYRMKHLDEIKTQKKKYREEHREEIAKASKLWREKNKEVLFKLFQCPKCNCMTSKKHIARHQKSAKCLNYNRENISQ